MGPHRQQGIYIGYDFPSIIRYMKPATTNVFKARFADFHFYKDISFNPSNKHHQDQKSVKSFKWQIDFDFETIQ
jgi:hypothetical protein